MVRSVWIVVFVACRSSSPPLVPVSGTAQEGKVVRRPIATGVSHTCVRAADGGVWCWGENDDGELGIPGGGERRKPTAVPGVPAVEGVAAGGSASCAWASAGDVWCWGSAPVPDSDDGVVVAPTKLAGLAHVAELRVEMTTGCARRLDGSVACWTPIAKPEHVVEVPNVRGEELAMADDLACSRSGGEVTCWNPAQPSPRVRSRLRGAVSIAIDGDQVFALLADHRVVSEKIEEGAEEGDAAKIQPRATAPSDARRIEAGTATVCAIGAGVSCWNVEQNDDPPEGTFVAVPTLAGATDIAVGNTHACARTAAGAVACWGDAELLGDGRTYEVGPIEVPGLRDVAQVVVEHEATCIRRANGTVACWGRWIGDPVEGADPYFNTPSEIIGIDDAIDIAVSWFAGCARRRSGDVVCWTTLGGKPVVEQVPAFAGATSLLLGAQTRCAMVRGKLVCDRGTMASPLPAGVKEVWLGFERICARRSDGHVRCASERAPEVDLGADVASVGFGLMDTCAVSRKGTVTCRMIPSAPLAVTGLPAPAVAVSSAHDQDCALLNDGRVACWKEPSDAAEPRAAALLPGITDAVELSGDTFNGCVRHKTGRVTCWGVHAFVGDGLGGEISTPVVLPLRI